MRHMLGHSVYTVETHIRHLAEAKLGTQFTVSTQIISADENVSVFDMFV